LGTSSATVRRDLDLLEEQRLLSRTHGGAVSHGALYELPLRYRSARHTDEKLRIGAAAAGRVSEGMVVGLTGGTTTTEVARVLSDRHRLTIVTNSLSIAAELAVRPNLKLVVTGGVARPESYELIGPLAEATMAELNLDLAIVGVDGISVEAGLTTHHEAEAHTNRAMIARAARALVVADSSKIGRVAFARICEVDRIGELITDTDSPAAELARLREAGVVVTTV
jgi:DeoR family transcriptional regulator of aga operon